MSYHPALTSRASAQFNDLATREDVHHAFMYRLLQLAEAPWDAWPVQPAGSEPDFRQAQFGEHGLLSFRVDDQAETLIIFSILWAGELRAATEMVTGTATSRCSSNPAHLGGDRRGRVLLRARPGTDWP